MIIPQTTSVVAQRATAIQKAVLRNQQACRAMCRQAKQCVWPVARIWHALTGWPQAPTDGASQRALLPQALSTLLQATGGAAMAALGAVCGLLHADARSLLNRGTGRP